MGFVILPSFTRLFNLPKNMHTSDEGNENNVLGLPYKLAKVSEGKKPYLVYYIWNENTEKLERVRREPPKGENAKTWFKERIKIINEHLVAGVRILKIKKIVIAKKPQIYTVLEALDEITKIRINNNVIGEMSQGRQKSFLNVFSKYLKTENLDTLLVPEIKKIHIITFIDKIVGKNSTKNNYLKYLKAMFSQILERDWITENPTRGVKQLKINASSSTAFDSEDLPQLKKLLIESNSELYIFCMFVFYTFIRPVELRRLTVGDVNLKDKNVSIKGINAKNAKNDYVKIPDVFANILIEYKFLERPKTDKLFELKNTVKYSKNYYSTLFRKICNANGYPLKYVLYGWKHTGVVEYYKKGARIKWLQMQCRHSSIDMTDKYLKSLGLFENDDILNNAPTI